MKVLCCFLLLLWSQARSSLSWSPSSILLSTSTIGNTAIVWRGGGIFGSGKCHGSRFGTVNHNGNIFRATTLLTSTTSSRSEAVVENNSSNIVENNQNDNETNKGTSFRQQFSKIVNFVKSAPLALSIAALFIGYKWGVKSAASAAAEAAASTTSKVASESTKSAVRQYPLVATILLVVAVRDMWSLVPDWAKKNIPLVGRKWRRKNSQAQDDSSAAEDLDDLTSFPAISMKLQSLFQRGKEKLSARGVEIESPVYVFLAILRLTSQLKQQLAHRRDETYKQSGTNIENPNSVLEGMDQAFEYADWAYDEFEEGESLKDNLASKGYSLLRHEKTALPGHVAHYVAVSPERKEALIGIKGTSGFEDLLTDCCGNSVRHEFKDGPFVEGGRLEISCHEGILLSSKRLAQDLLTFVESFLLPLGYKITVVGHSLGAGVAVIFAMILRSRIAELRKDKGEKLKVLAFASPPILDITAARNCESFVTTFVNNSDIIPRSSLSNLILLMTFMNTVNKRLDEEGLSPRGFRSTAKFIKMLTDDKHSEMILSPDEIREAVDDALDNIEIDDPDHLYVGGRVIHMYDEWTKEGYGNKSDYEDVGDDFDESMKVPTAEKVYESDGSAKALRIIELDDRMLSDHMSAGYRASFRSLLDKSLDFQTTVDTSETKASEKPEIIE